MYISPLFSLPSHLPSRTLKPHSVSSAGLRPSIQKLIYQSEHRQRQKNLVAHLEHDLIQLRENIAIATTQSVLFKHENIAMKDLLTENNVVIPPLTTAPLPVPTSTSSLSKTSTSPQERSTAQEFDLMDVEQSNGGNGKEEGLELSDEEMVWLMDSAVVRTEFDPWIGSEVLQIQPAAIKPTTQTHSHAHPQSQPQAQRPQTQSRNHKQSGSINFSHKTQPLQQLHQQYQAIAALNPPPLPSEDDIATVAINFILAYVPPLPLSPQIHLHTSPFSHATSEVQNRYKYVADEKQT